MNLARTTLLIAVALLIPACSVQPRNWHHYWRDGNVIDGVRDFYYVDTEQFRGVSWPAGVSRGQPKALGNPVVLSKVGGNLMRHPRADPSLPLLRWVGVLIAVRGIDATAATILHEDTHIVTFNTNNPLIQAWIAAGKPGGNSNPDSDEDLDGVTRGNEITNGTDPAWSDTYNVAGATSSPAYALYGDNEFLSRRIETTNPLPARRGGLDWGYPGRNKGTTPW